MWRENISSFLAAQIRPGQEKDGQKLYFNQWVSRGTQNTPSTRGKGRETPTHVLQHNHRPAAGPGEPLT